MAVKSFNMWIFLTIVIIGQLASLLSAEPIPLPESDLINHEHNVQRPQQRVRRQYFVCPPDFERISSNCYYFSKHMATWQDAIFECRDRDSELAILQNPAEDKKLRGQLNRVSNKMEWWIGGIYDWEQMKWKWGSSGKALTYHGFSRMGPENKDKLKWHCIVLDPTMKYKWSARSCVHGKHFICQKKGMRVGKRGLEKLRKKYNNTLNEIPAPLIYDKPRKPKKQENLSNGHSKTHLKQHRPNGINVQNNYRAFNSAYGHRRNNTEIRKRRKERKNREGQRKNKNRKYKNYGLENRNGTDFSLINSENGYAHDYRRDKKRNRRNKSKESKESKENNSLESTVLAHDNFNQKKKKVWNNDNNAMEDMSQKTTYMTNTLSPLHPRVIVEEHDFLN